MDRNDSSTTRIKQEVLSDNENADYVIDGIKEEVLSDNENAGYVIDGNLKIIDDFCVEDSEGTEDIHYSKTAIKIEKDSDSEGNCSSKDFKFEDPRTNGNSSNQPSDSKFEDPSTSGNSNNQSSDNRKEAEPIEDSEEFEIVKMSVEGVEDDPDEPSVLMTAEEVKSYLVNKINEYMKDPKVNPILALKLESLKLEDDVKQRTKELKQVRRMFEKMFKDQEKFLRHVGAMPKLATNEVAVEVDMPLLPDSIPKLSKDTKAESSMENQPAASTSNPPNATNSASDKPTNLPSRQIECIDLTDDTESSDESGVATDGSGENSDESSEMADASAAVARGRATVASGRATVASGRATVTNGRATVASGRAAVAIGKAAVGSGRATIGRGKAAVGSGRATVGRATIGNGRAAGASRRTTGASGRTAGTRGRVAGASGRVAGASGRVAGASGRVAGANGRVSGVSGRAVGARGRAAGARGRAAGARGRAAGARGRTAGASGRPTLTTVRPTVAIGKPSVASGIALAAPQISGIVVGSVSNANSYATSASGSGSVPLSVPVQESQAFPCQFPLKHPAPLPPSIYGKGVKEIFSAPMKPNMLISVDSEGIVLKWDMPFQPQTKLASFEIFGYQERNDSPVVSSLWKKIGDVKALTLPMSCTLSQFVEGFRYHFSIRAVDIHDRCGVYSDPATIVFIPQQAQPQPMLFFSPVV